MGTRYAEAALAHDWTGVFASGPAGREHVVVTAAHHLDNAFYQLGVVEHEVTPAQLLAYLPDEPPHECATAEICWMLDFHDANGDLVDNREVTAEKAAALLGRDIDDLLSVGQANHAAWVDHPVHDQ